MEQTKETLIQRRIELNKELARITEKLNAINAAESCKKDTYLMSVYDDIFAYAKVISREENRVHVLMVDLDENSISSTYLYCDDICNDWTTCKKEAFDTAYNTIITKINKEYNEQS